MVRQMDFLRFYKSVQKIMIILKFITPKHFLVPQSSAIGFDWIKAEWRIAECTNAILMHNYMMAWLPGGSVDLEQHLEELKQE
mgnify:CR=1 FL=1